MYNLLVSADQEAWKSNSYAFDKSRFLEYTNENIANSFTKLEKPQIIALQSYPTLFAYEGEKGEVRIGNLTSITESDRKITIEYYIPEDIAPIPFEVIKPLTKELDIRSWEMNRTHWAIKDKSLFSTLKKNGIDLAEKYKDNKKSTLEPFKEENKKIATVKEFIDIILSFKKNSYEEVFYRGHSDSKKYKLEPSLFRKDESGNYLYKDSEHILYRELLVSNSEDFQTDIYTLDSLVRMQHYSLPTRLLDITSNPLIALYFACKSSFEHDGELITFAINRENIKYFDSDVASCIANLARLPQKEKNSILFYEAGFNEQAPIKRLIHFIREEKPYFEAGIHPRDLQKIICIKGKKNNERISSQSGAFLLFGLDAIFNERGTSDIKVSRTTITNKKNILRELDVLNINESTVFPYIETSARHIAEKYKFRN